MFAYNKKENLAIREIYFKEGMEEALSIIMETREYDSFVLAQIKHANAVAYAQLELIFFPINRKAQQQKQESLTKRFWSFMTKERKLENIFDILLP
jgi:hypothetical protein